MYTPCYLDIYAELAPPRLEGLRTEGMRLRAQTLHQAVLSNSGIKVLSTLFSI